MRVQARKSNTQATDLAGHCGLRDLAAGHAERGGTANRSRLCGALGENEPQTACRPAAHTGALPPCSRRFRQIHPERFRPGGGLCLKRIAGRQRRMACGYDEVSLSRHLRRIRLPGAVPLLLRQRRHQLRRVASEADLGEKHDAGAWKWRQVPGVRIPSGALKNALQCTFAMRFLV